MKTLEEHNEERRIAYRQMMKAAEPHPNRIECPKCGAELWDSNPCMTLDSMPPQKNVHCPKCGYRGFRLD